MILIHYIVIDEYFSEFKDGELDQRGIRDVSLFLSALNEPKQTFDKKELYPDVLTKAAVYLRSFALNHCFHNGNKRTALMAMIIFLDLNGYDIIVPQRKMLSLARTIVIVKPTIKKIKEKYLKKYCKYRGKRKQRNSYLDLIERFSQRLRKKPKC